MKTLKPSPDNRAYVYCHKDGSAVLALWHVVKLHGMEVEEHCSSFRFKSTQEAVKLAVKCTTTRKAVKVNYTYISK